MPRLAAPAGLHAVPGFRAMGVHCGLKSGRRPDVALIVSDHEATAGAAVFTQNPFAAAPVHLSRQHVANGDVRAIVANAGNANACTGRQGLRDALAMARTTAEALGVRPEQVLVASTGIIGRPLPTEKVLAGIRDCAGRLDDAQGTEAAHAILTTDSGPKQAHHGFDAGGRTITVAGIAKGAGMIRPNMATMLAFLASDAPVAPNHLRDALRTAVEASFNQIVVDGDESTNDMAAILASGAAGGAPLAPGAPGWDAFQDAVTRVCTDLAQQIAADGEGATRLMEVRVEGAATIEEARRAARAVAGSTLVKCALHGADPNWGRIVAAAGASRAAADPGRTSLRVEAGNEQAVLLQDGTPVEADREPARELLARPEVRIVLHLGVGEAAGTAWGCDLTTDYVTFNAQYET